MAVDYFWETEYKFGEFLKRIFGENIYKRKYSLEGNGIYDLLLINNDIYECKYTQARQHIKEDNHSIDATKKYIIDTIVENLTENTEHHIAGGKFITFNYGSWIAKVEIIKKKAMPK